MEGTSGTNWLGMTSASLMSELSSSFTDAESMSVFDADIVDLKSLKEQRVKAAPLLLQVGILSRVPGQEGMCRLPNKYARETFIRMLETAVPGKTADWRAMADALRDQDRQAFTREATRVLELLPNSLIKDSRMREAPFHGALLGAVFTNLSPVHVATPEKSVQRGRSDLMIEFSSTPPTTWVIEIGCAEEEDVAAAVKDKLDQAVQYTKGAHPSTQVVCCVVIVGKPRPASVADGRAGAVFAFEWYSRDRASDGTTSWARMPDSADAASAAVSVSLRGN